MGGVGEMGQGLGGWLRVNCSKGQGGKEMMESLLKAVGGLLEM